MTVLETNVPGKMDVSSRRAIIGSIAVSIAFVMELTLVPLVLPAIQAEFDLDVITLAWVFNAYSISVAAGVLLGGWLGDVFGIRRVFILGVMLFAFGSFIVSVAEAFETVIGGRVIQGFGGGIFSPLVPLLLTRAVPYRPGKILIIWGSIVGYVAAFAPLVLSRALSDSGWQAAFVLIAITALVALAINGRMKSAAHEERPKIRPSFASLLRVRELWMVYGYIFCTYGTISFYLFQLPLTLAESNYDVTTVGLILSMIWLSFSVAGTLLRNKVDGPHTKLIILCAPVLLAAALPLAFYAGNTAGFMISAFLIGTGFACSNAPSTQKVLKFAPDGMRAISTSLDITFARLGGVSTVAVLAQLGPTGAMYALFAVCACAIFFISRALRAS